MLRLTLATSNDASRIGGGSWAGSAVANATNENAARFRSIRVLTEVLIDEAGGDATRDAQNAAKRAEGGEVERADDIDDA